jgi:hypothetical protein
VWVCLRPPIWSQAVSTGVRANRCSADQRLKCPGSCLMTSCIAGAFQPPKMGHERALFLSNSLVPHLRPDSFLLTCIPSLAAHPSPETKTQNLSVLTAAS